MLRSLWGHFAVKEDHSHSQTHTPTFCFLLLCRFAVLLHFSSLVRLCSLCPITSKPELVNNSENNSRAAPVLEKKRKYGNLSAHSEILAVWRRKVVCTSCHNILQRKQLHKSISPDSSLLCLASSSTVGWALCSLYHLPNQLISHSPLKISQPTF